MASVHFKGTIMEEIHAEQKLHDTKSLSKSIVLILLHEEKNSAPQRCELVLEKSVEGNGNHLCGVQPK